MMVMVVVVVIFGEMELVLYEVVVAVEHDITSSATNMVVLSF